MATTDVPDWLRNSACPRLRFPGDVEAEEVDVLLRTFLLAAPPRRREALACGATGRRNGGTMGILRAGLLLLPLLLLLWPAASSWLWGYCYRLIVVIVQECQQIVQVIRATA